MLERCRNQSCAVEGWGISGLITAECERATGGFSLQLGNKDRTGEWLAWKEVLNENITDHLMRFIRCLICHISGNTPAPGSVLLPQWVCFQWFRSVCRVGQWLQEVHHSTLTLLSCCLCPSDIRKTRRHTTNNLYCLQRISAAVCWSIQWR